MAHRSIRETIFYSVKEPERQKKEQGREDLILTGLVDGASKLLAHCIIDGMRKSGVIG